MIIHRMDVAIYPKTKDPVFHGDDFLLLFTFCCPTWSPVVLGEKLVSCHIILPRYNLPKAFHASVSERVVDGRCCCMLDSAKALPKIQRPIFFSVLVHVFDDKWSHLMKRTSLRSLATYIRV